jgi:glycosyltransferase involved in cell wall biosynthesis
MMHVLFITDNFIPETNAPASRTFEHTKEWVKSGHLVTVITCAPNYPDGVIYPGFKNKLWQSSTSDNVRVIRVWSYMSKNEGVIKRTLDFMSFMIMSFLASFFLRKVDIVIGTSPQFFTVISAWAISVIKRVPFVFELRDLWPEGIRVVGAIKSRALLKLLESIELFLYQRADLIVVVTNSFKAVLTSRGVDEKKIVVVTNGVDQKRFFPRKPNYQIIRDLDIPDSFVAGYIGTHGMAHALETILNAAEIIQLKKLKKNITFLFIGNGAEKNNLKNLARSKNLTNIIFLDSVPKNEVANYWSILDAAIVHLKDEKLHENVIPSKIFESMGMGIPVILGLRGESADIVETAGCGCIVPPEQPNALAEKVLELADSPDYLKVLSNNSYLASKQFTRESLAEQMLNHIVKVYKNNAKNLF